MFGIASKELAPAYVPAIVVLQTNAGYTPQRETLLKIWRRYVKENDKDGARKVESIIKRLGYRDCHTNLGKIQLIATI